MARVSAYLALVLKARSVEDDFQFKAIIRREVMVDQDRWIHPFIFPSERDLH